MTATLPTPVTYPVSVPQALWATANRAMHDAGFHFHAITEPAPGYELRHRTNRIPRLAKVRVGQPLTERELQILSGMACGLENHEIGTELHLTENTIKTHAQRLYGKLGARNRAHAVHIAHRLGLLPDDAANDTPDGAAFDEIDGVTL